MGFEDVAHRVFEGMAQVDTQQLVEQVVFGVAVVSNGPAYVLFDEISFKEMDATYLEQAVFMTPVVSDGW